MAIGWIRCIQRVSFEILKNMKRVYCVFFKFKQKNIVISVFPKITKRMAIHFICISTSKNLSEKISTVKKIIY